MNTKNTINQDAFDLIVNNMRENKINSKKIFARYMLNMEVEEFAKLLLDAWQKAGADENERLATGFPQLAQAILEYYTLPEKKREKYLQKLIN